MPSTTRYSATFDRPYEEDERAMSNNSNGMRRSRSQSWQANLGMDGRTYSPLDSNSRLSQRSSSTDSGSNKTTDIIPTRTLSKPIVKSHNNPFQFVKIGSSPLYRKAEEQLKKTKEVKKVETLKEEEEEWQSNLDSWKSRRRKMSEDVFRRQEEIRQFELEQQQQSFENSQKKIKKFSEMVESRAHRGRTLSCCLISSPLDLQKWDMENNNLKSTGSEGSEENSIVNSEDEGIGFKGIIQNNLMNKKSQSTENIISNGSSNTKNKFFELGSNGMSPNNGNYFDSGLESISSSHRAGDTPDSCSDFSQDSGSGIDCDSPRVSGLILNGVNLLEKFNSKDFQDANGHNLLNNQNITSNSKDEPSLNYHYSQAKNEVSTNGQYVSSSRDLIEFSENLHEKQERSVESENEVFVDELEESNSNERSQVLNSEPARATDSEINKKKDSKNTANINLFDSKTNISEDSLSIIYQSQNNRNNKSQEEQSISEIKEQMLLKDVPPVEQVAEEMERLILQQLEEEEQAKEMSMKMSSENIFESPEHNGILRSRSAEPPKEKPPPPPSIENDGQKSTSLKRINSTKRIKKEICKRRSNFLGIENDEAIACDELTIPPPPALEQILKAEMELDRESRKRLENNTMERLALEETEIRKKEQEIIDSIETEERQKQLIINCDDLSDTKSDCAEVCNIVQGEDRIEILKEERKRIEKERLLSEEQRLRLIEEKQLREREELIKKQEADNSTITELSAPLLSDTANLFNASNKTSFSSSDTKLKVCGSCVNGDGRNNASNAGSDQNKDEISDISLKPVIPPKPLKKKEALRKERERLRQEQEALVREREEHRRKLIEEEKLLKSNASEGHVSRLGPLPSLIKPAFVPQLTSPISAQSSARENATVNHNYCTAQNSMLSHKVCADPPSQIAISKCNKPIPPPKKTVKSELKGQQKVSCVRKQSQERLSESKYNQNHWLIQEAEMRRITELKERQRASQFSNSQTHLAEDDVCRASVLSPGLHLNNPVKEKIWNYGHSNVAIKKYPPPLCSEKPIGAYPREQPPAKPSRILPLARQELMLSVSGRKRCSHCIEELGRGAAMIIESLQLYYHIHCFQCCVCQAQLGNGSCGTDVRVRNNKLHCHNCYSNDEAGLKFSQV